jgi:hypothetical protein
VVELLGNEMEDFHAIDDLERQRDTIWGLDWRVIDAWLARWKRLLIDMFLAAADRGCLARLRRIGRLLGECLSRRSNRNAGSRGDA